jgi:hypothetical protein
VVDVGTAATLDAVVHRANISAIHRAQAAVDGAIAACRDG